MEKTLESPLDWKEIQPVHPKGNQSWIFFGRTDAGVETPILWPPDVKNWLIWKDIDAWKDWGQEEKGTTEDEIAGGYQRLDGRESEWTLGVGDGQGVLGCCDSWGHSVGHDWATELNDYWCWASFQISVEFLYIFFRDTSIQAFVSFLIGLFEVLAIELCELFIHFGYQSLIKHDLQIFFPLCRLSFHLVRFLCCK